MVEKKTPVKKTVAKKPVAKKTAAKKEPTVKTPKEIATDKNEPWVSVLSVFDSSFPDCIR